MTTPLWIEHAACNRADTRGLPWLKPHEATPRQLALMLRCCETCPVFAECETEMHTHQDYVGVRAGVVHTIGNGDPSRQRVRVVETRCRWCDSPVPVEGNPRNTGYCSNRCRYRARRDKERTRSAVRRAELREEHAS